MNSLNCAGKMIASVPKYNLARNMNQIPSIYLPAQRIDIPAPPPNRSAQISDRLLFSWYDSAWNKTKNMVLDNWESAGLIKRRKPNEEIRPQTTIVNRGDSVSVPTDELSKAKNKAQRQLAENWDVIRQANAKTSQSLVDNAKQSATMTIDELSKSAKETAGKLIDETTKEIKLKIKEKADVVKEKISAGKLVDETTKELKSKFKDTADDVKKMTSNIIEKGDEATREVKSKIQETADDVKKMKSKIIEKGDEAAMEIKSKIKETADDLKEKISK